MRKRDLKPGKEIDMPETAIMFISHKMKHVAAMTDTIVRLSMHCRKVQDECTEVLELLIPELKGWIYDFNAKNKKILLKYKKEEEL